MPKPKERPAAKKAAPAAKAASKSKSLTDKTKVAVKAKPVPVHKAVAAKAPPVKVASKAAKPVAAKVAKPAAKVAKPAAKPPVQVKSKPAAKVQSAVTSKPVAASSKPVQAKISEKPKSAAKPSPALVAKSAAPAAKPAPAPIAKIKPAAEKAAKPAKGETKPVVATTPVVEKQLKPAKIIAPVSPSKVVKMSKQTEHSNGHSSAKGMPKCPFNAEELDQWRKLLISRRFEISSDIGALEKDAMEAEDGHTTPLHAAERGSDADLQDVSLGLAGEEKNLLWQIDRAIRKIDVNSPLPFGVCEHTREPIPKLRLQLIPWTPLSIEGATYLEENGLTVEDLLIDD